MYDSKLPQSRCSGPRALSNEHEVGPTNINIAGIGMTSNLLDCRVKWSLVDSFSAAQLLSRLRFAMRVLHALHGTRRGIPDGTWI